MSAERIAEIRRDLGLTQAEVARILGVHVNTVVNREGGAVPVKAEHVMAMEWLLSERLKWLAAERGDR
jgi:DNA-binding transcriptional regulator YiaG